MGTGFTIDTPIKVAKYGISSVISLVDDVLIEQMRNLVDAVMLNEVLQSCRAELISKYQLLIPFPQG